MPQHLIGMDVGGTKTEVCLIKLSNSNFESYEILERERVPTQGHGGFDTYLGEVVKLTTSLLSRQKLSMKDLGGMGIGMPGTIDPKRNIMLQGNQKMFIGKPLETSYRQAFSCATLPLIFENDANCFVLAEGTFGAGADFCKAQGLKLQDSLFLGITLGTGVGGGILYQGKIIRGKNGGAAEFGHLSLDPPSSAVTGTSVLPHGFSVSCYCGKQNCAELYLSGHGFSVFPIEIYRDRLATFLSNLSNAFDPDAIIFGGGVSGESSIYENLVSDLGSRCFLHQRPPAILKNKNGDSAGVLGSAFLVYERIKKAGAAQ